MNSVILVGYSGHAFVAADILVRSRMEIKGYLEPQEKVMNPFRLTWLGDDNDDVVIKKYKGHSFFVAIGDNQKRNDILKKLIAAEWIAVNAIDPSALISSMCTIHGDGIMIGSRAVVNPLAEIGTGVILNTGCIIEHECKVDNFAHIGPGAVLCGNVHIGANAFIGAGAVVKEGVKIGRNVVVGAGSVIIRDISDNLKVAGNPGRNL